MILASTFFSPEEWMQYRTFLVFDYPDNELPDRVKAYKDAVEKVISKYGKD
jgi:hypothetical protein